MNLFVLPSLPPTTNPPPSCKCSKDCVRQLESMPGFWRGKAYTRKAMGQQFADEGRMEDARRHMAVAAQYERIAEAGASVTARMKDAVA